MASSDLNGRGFRWSPNQLKLTIENATPKAKAYISRLGTYYALQLEGQARTNAPWKDRTPAARPGLAATAINSAAQSGHWEIQLYHQVKYGMWLELRWGGKYAIILPTIRAVSPNYYDDVKKIFDVMFGGASL